MTAIAFPTSIGRTTVLILGRTTCSICKTTIADGEPIFGTWGVWLPATDPLWRFCDAPIHWACYATWPERPRFAATYFDFWVRNEQESLWWHRAYLATDVFVSVNPTEPIRSTWVHLRATGSRTPVKLPDWATWLASDTPTEHRVEDESLTDAKQRLRLVVPTEQALLDAIDLSAKQALFEHHRAEERGREEQRRAAQLHTNRYNAACNQMMRSIEQNGFRCTHCQVESKDFRLARRPNQRSAIICKRCGWTVEPPGQVS